MDREDVLWKAEKLVRQGRLNLAITEYKRVVDEYPQDWSTANTLGDLYLRAQQADKAVEQYVRIANHLAEDGFLPKAAALYKKALKIRPDDDHCLLQLADLALRQSRQAEARQYFNQAAVHRRAAGNLAGAAEVLMRVGALDPDDVEARLAGIRAVAEAGQSEVAAVEFIALADELEARGRTRELIEVLEEAGRLAPHDRAIRGRVARGLAEHGQAFRARQHAQTADDFRDLVNVFAAFGDADGVLQCLEEVVRLDPTDAAAAARIVQMALERDQLAAARPYLAIASETSDPAQLLLVGEALARTGEIEEARVVFTRLLSRVPHEVDAVVSLGARLVSTNSSASLACIEAAASIHLLRGDFAAAADAYERLLTQDPVNLTALMCLVELCVEGSLDGQLIDAQSRLVDAYLAHGKALEARAVAEDLATRTRDPAHVQQFRQALEASGEPAPDRLVAERLGQDVDGADSWGGGDSLAAAGAEPETGTPAPGEQLFAEPQPPGASREAAPPSDPFRLGPLAIDLRSILGEALDADPEPLTSAPSREDEVTERPKRKTPPAGERAGTPGAKKPGSPPDGPSRVEDVFADFHDEVSREADAALAEQHYKVGLTYRDMGMLPEAIAELELAVRSPKLRFDAAALLARLSLQRGAVSEAIDWFERAAEAPAPSTDAARSLLYELGDTLEAGGESARALAVFLELQAEAGDYRDVPKRVERLSRVQTGG